MLYVQEVTVLSDELLLNQQKMPVTSGSTGLSVLVVLQGLTRRVDPVRFSIATSSVVPLIGEFVAEAARNWSANAGTLMSMARVTYRMLNLQLALSPIGDSTHVLSDSAGTLDLSRFSIAQTRALANDVTVCGASEPQAYVTDVFQGDGVTTTFQLTRKPMTVSALKGALVNDAFQGPGRQHGLVAAQRPWLQDFADGCGTYREWRQRC